MTNIGGSNKAPKTGLRTGNEPIRQPTTESIKPGSSAVGLEQPVDEQLRGAPFEHDQMGRTVRTNLSPRGEQVLSRFMTDVEQRTEMTARDLFNQDLEQIDGHPLRKKIPDDEMKRMVTDVAKNMPLCDLPGGEQIASAVSQLPGANGIEGDISQMSYKELSKALPDAARDQLEEKFKPLVKDFRKNHSAAFYSLVALGAVGIGALGYTQGSDALKKLGIKPKLRKKFFSDHLRATVEAEWGKKFSDPSGRVSVEGRSQDGRLSILGSTSFDGDGMKTATVRGRARIDNQPLGLDQLALHGSYTHDFVNNQDLSSLGVSGSKGALSFTATDTRNWTTGDSRSELDLSTKVWGGRLSGYAAHIEEGRSNENQVGVVFRIAF